MAGASTELLTDVLTHVRQSFRSKVWKKLGAEVFRESRCAERDAVQDFDLSPFNCASASSAMAVSQMVFAGSFYDVPVLLHLPSLFGDPSTAKRTVIQLTGKESLDSALVLVEDGMVFTYNIDPGRLPDLTRDLIFKQVALLCGFHPAMTSNLLPVTTQVAANDRLEAQLLVVFLTSLAQRGRSAVSSGASRSMLYRFRMMLALTRLWKKGVDFELLLDERNVLDHFRVLVGDNGVYEEGYSLIK
jgi:hypothetical protein